MTETASKSTSPARPVYVPHVNVIETPEAVELVAAVPGADENSTELTLEQDLLTLRARVTPSEFPEHRLVYAEYGEGDYERSFRLSDQIDRTGIEAKVKDGVLRVRLPKVAAAQTKKITVLAG